MVSRLVSSRTMTFFGLATTVVVPLACWMSSLDWARAGSADKASRAPMGGKKQRRTAPLWCNAYARPGPGRPFPSGWRAMARSWRMSVAPGVGNCDPSIK